MAKRYTHNPTANTMFVGGTMIPPGEGREIDEEFLPAEADADTSAAPDDGGGDPATHLRELLKHPVKDLQLALPDCTDAELAALAAMEGERAEPRKTLLAAIAEQQLERAQTKTGAPT